MNIKPKTNIVELFDDAKYRGTYLKICAPMVRYSKLEFRTLVRKYGVDLCFTPMIMTDSFCQSNKARVSEFSTNDDDTPLIGQFAANNIQEYLSATEMIYPYVDGIDLNCGCPQRWAVSDGYGSALLNTPEVIHDLTSTIRRNFPSSFSVSVKLRVQNPLSKSINLCRQLEKCGVNFLTIHGRTATQKIKEPSNIEFLREIKQSLSIPVIANGDCKSKDDADSMYERINCNGVMAARGILANPTLFSGQNLSTPMDCVQDWVNLGCAAGNNISFQVFHHHFTFMMEKILRRRDRVVFNSFTRKEQLLEYLANEFNIRPQSIKTIENLECSYDDTTYRNRMNVLRIPEKQQYLYNTESTAGQFFLNQKEEEENPMTCDNGLDFMESSLFDVI